MQIANALSGDTINFGLANPATITLTTGEIMIGKNLTISGPGLSNLAISGNNLSRVFFVNYATVVAISGVTVQNGDVPLDIGGGIYNLGTLTLTKLRCYSSKANLRST